MPSTRCVNPATSTVLISCLMLFLLFLLSTPPLCPPPSLCAYFPHPCSASQRARGKVQNFSQRSHGGRVQKSARLAELIRGAGSGGSHAPSASPGQDA
eukprot:768181-Hanusia_phi.AAC.2